MLGYDELASLGVNVVGDIVGKFTRVMVGWIIVVFIALQVNVGIFRLFCTKNYRVTFSARFGMTGSLGYNNNQLG